MHLVKLLKSHGSIGYMPEYQNTDRSLKKTLMHVFHFHVRDLRLNVKNHSCRQASLPEQGTAKFARAPCKCMYLLCRYAFERLSYH